MGNLVLDAAQRLRICRVGLERLKDSRRLRLHGTEARAGLEGVGVAPAFGEFAALGGFGGMDAAEARFIEHFAGAVRMVEEDERATVGGEPRVAVEEGLLVDAERGGKRLRFAFAQADDAAGDAATGAAAAAAECGEVHEG